jgi:hypothetical protein
VYKRREFLLSFGRFEEVNDSTSVLARHRIFCSRSKHGQTRGVGEVGHKEASEPLSSTR